MFKAVLLQLLMTFVAAGVAGLWVGARGAVSALLGGSAVLVPGLLFALSLWAAARSGRTSVAGFLVGEFFKVAATLALLVIVVGAYRELHWPALLAGLIVALKANLLVTLIKA